MTLLQFGSSESVAVAVPETEFREGWVEAHVEVSVEGFRGSISACFETHDFERFYEQLRSVHETLKGRAELMPREKQFILSVSAGTGGHITVAGEAWSKATHGNKLQFSFELDQTFLAAPLSQLREILGKRGAHVA